MSIRVLFSDTEEKWDDWNKHLTRAFTDFDLKVNLHRSFETPESEDYIVYSPDSSLQDFSNFTNLKAVLSMWAGVEKIANNKTLLCPLTRMVDPGLTAGMIEYVTAHVLRYHLNLDRHTSNSKTWFNDAMTPLATSRNVGILGLGQLGQACAKSLQQFGFKIYGWSRSPKQIECVSCHSGQIGLNEVLSQSDILILLLPNTPETMNILNQQNIRRLPKGASIINPGRGALIVDEHLIDALESDQISGATLDVFRKEPLPQNHPFWSHPKITITPHIAAETRPETAAEVIAKNIRRYEDGKKLLHLVNRTTGY